MRKVKQPLDLTFRRVDPKVVAAIKSYTKMERISRNELLREMVKLYQDKCDREMDALVGKVIAEAQDEPQNPGTIEDLRRENECLTGFGTKVPRQAGHSRSSDKRAVRDYRESRL